MCSESTTCVPVAEAAVTAPSPQATLTSSGVAALVMELASVIACAVMGVASRPTARVGLASAVSAMGAAVMGAAAVPLLAVGADCAVRRVDRSAGLVNVVPFFSPAWVRSGWLTPWASPEAWSAACAMPGMREMPAAKTAAEAASRR